MPTPELLKAAFYPETFYHIVCKSIDGLLLFQDNNDYKTFNQRFKKFIGDVLDLWSFCQIPNHSHHIVRIKSSDQIRQFILGIAPGNLTVAMKNFSFENDNEILFDKMIERQLNSFLVSYANYTSNKYNRKGEIFQKPFKRIKIDGEGHLQQAIIYTNANAQKHKLVKDYKQYLFSSYASTIKYENYFMDSKGVIEFFNGIENFVLLHEQQVAYFYDKHWPSSN